MPVSTRRNHESLGATLSRVEEEARGIGKVQAMVEKVVGNGGGLQEVGMPATGIGTIKEVLGQVKEAAGDLTGNVTHRWVMFSSLRGYRKPHHIFSDRAKDDLNLQTLVQLF